MDWQSYIAIGIVLVTAGIFVARLLRGGKKNSGCGDGSGCGKK